MIAFLWIYIIIGVFSGIALRLILLEVTQDEVNDEVREQGLPLWFADKNTMSVLAGLVWPLVLVTALLQ